MSFGGGTLITGIPGMSVIDVLPGTTEDALRELQAIHLRHFESSYPWAVSDFEQTWLHGAAQSNVIEHQWLLLIDGKTCGECVFHVNLDRKVILRHYMAVDQEVRAELPSGWLTAFNDFAEAWCDADSRAHGIELLAMMSEIQPKHVAGWKRMGHLSPAIDYREPTHGKHWKEYGDVEFVPMSVNLKLLPAGKQVPLREVTKAAVSAFLIDNYGLSESNPTVQSILFNCEQLD